MTNLVDKYGTDWFLNKFRGTYFSYNGIPARVTGASREGVNATVVPRINDEVVARPVIVPNTYFMDSSRFNVPELGYRHDDGGKWLGFLKRNNSSYVRGLSTRNIVSLESDITKFLRTRTRVKVMSENDINNIVMQPKFIPLYRGIQLMLAGKIVSFAASPTIAVVPSRDGRDPLEIMVCEKVVGTVSDEGTMNIQVPVARTYIEELG